LLCIFLVSHKVVRSFGSYLHTLWIIRLTMRPKHELGSSGKLRSDCSSSLLPNAKAYVPWPIIATPVSPLHIDGLPIVQRPMLVPLGVSFISREKKQGFLSSFNIVVKNKQTRGRIPATRLRAFLKIYCSVRRLISVVRSIWLRVGLVASLFIYLLFLVFDKVFHPQGMCRPVSCELVEYRSGYSD